MMNESTFSFNQMKLQDYIACERRFELKYILRQAWPAVRSQPVLELERQMQIGQQFHLFCQQFFSGIPEKDIRIQINHPQLEVWWQYFSSFAHIYLNQSHFAEYKIATRIFDHSVVAILDLLVATEDGKLIIFDWKTNSKKPSFEIIRSSIQTRLYPFLLATVGYEYHQEIIPEPDDIEMIYWFANFPEEPSRIPYSTEQYKQDQIYFKNLFSEIVEKKENQFIKTADLFRCKFCQYRSLCERGTIAGFDEDDVLETWNEKITEFDFDQIGEIEF